MSVLAGLEPQSVFKYFEEICGIPHGSSNTKQISDYLVKFAKERGLRYIQDEKNNVIIFKDGSRGYEKSKPVIIQGHIDMVCEKEKDCDIDFEKEGLRLQCIDGVISAKGTTLGGDDGIAVAYAMAILDSDTIKHPPIEAVFTVDEEIGMLGAEYIDCSPLQGRLMLNIDSEDEGELLVSCAGGATVKCVYECKMEKHEGTAVKICVSGLCGGHSGVEIDKGRANACQIIGRVLYELDGKTDYALKAVNGGMKDNAIPREAEAEIVISEADMARLEACVADINNILSHEYSETDGNIHLYVEKETSYDNMAMENESKRRVIAALFNMPCGVQKMSREIEGLVETSLNIGILRTTGKTVSVVTSVRSSVGSEKTELIEKIESLAGVLGGSVSVSGNYPAWEYKKDSYLREVMTDIYMKMTGKSPKIEAIHAGVECGIFAGKLPGLDCVSFGPDIFDIHTTAERMKADSVLRIWNYILKVLEALV